MKTKKILLSSILTLALCLSLICGATFALFTSESTANIAISSGKVNMTAEIENKKLSYQVPNEEHTAYETVEGELFAGTATVDGNKITLEKLVPGDKITFDIVIYNESNVASKYQTLIGVSEDDGLFDGLVVTLNGDTYNGTTAKSEWIDAEAVAEKTEIQTVSVSIELPIDAGNEYQDKSCELYLTVNAVQGNALCTNPVENTVELYTARDLVAYANNPGSYTTVKLMNDIDMTGVEFNGIGTSTAPFNNKTFDGNDYTISGMNIERDDIYVGFIAYNDSHASATVKDLTITNSTFKGKSNVGAIYGAMWAGEITNCKVENCTVIATRYVNEWENVGAVAGLVQGKVTGCTVSETTVTGRDAAGIVGAVTGGEVSDNTIGENVVVKGIEHAAPYANDASEVSSGTVTIEDNIGTATIVEMAVATSQDSFNAAIVNGANEVVLGPGEYTIPDNAKGKTLTITGTKDTIIECVKAGEGDYGLDGATVTFEGVTLNFGEQDFNGYVRAKATYIDCIINGRITLYGESTFTNCTFNNMEGYNVWTWGSNATFENCTFNSGGKSVLVYGSGSSGSSTVTINNCTFNDKGGFVDKAAIETGSDYGESFTININNVTVNGFDENPNGTPTYSNIWANKNSMPKDRLNVVIDGVDVY